MKGLPLLAHEAAFLTLPIALLLGLALVMQLLALGQAKLHLGDPARIEIELERNDRHALPLNGAGETPNLFPVQQKLAAPRRSMTAAASLGVLGDVGVDQIKLAALARGIGVRDIGPAGAERLYLGAHQRDARLELLLDVVVEARLPVLGDELAALALRRHDVTFSELDENEADRRKCLVHLLTRSRRERRERKPRLFVAQSE